MIPTSVGRPALCFLAGAATIVAAPACTPSASPEQSADVALLTTDTLHPLAVANDEDVDGFARVGAVGALSNGAVYVADVRLSNLFLFPRGESPTVAAEKGPGPHEFSQIYDAGPLPGDSILVVGVDKLGVLDPQGEFERSIPIPFPGYGPRPVGVVRDSVLVLEYGLRGFSLAEEGLREDTAWYMTLNLSDGAVRHEFKRPYRYSFVKHRPGRQPFWTFPPFLPRAVAAARDSLVVWGMGNQPTLYLLNERGEAVDSVSLRAERIRLRRSEVGDALRSRIAGATSPEERVLWEDMFDRVPFPSDHPVFDDLLLGPDSLYWLRSPAYSGAAQEQQERWTAFGGSGAARAVLYVPAGLQVRQFLDGAVLALRTRDSGVQEVVVLALIQAEPTT